MYLYVRTCMRKRTSCFCMCTCMCMCISIRVCVRVSVCVCVCVSVWGSCVRVCVVLRVRNALFFGRFLSALHEHL